MTDSRKRWFFIVVLIAMAAAGFLFFWGADSKKNHAGKPPKSMPLVSLMEAEPIDLPIRFAAQGHLVALNRVDVRPQVSGTILGVHFKEGDDIKQGQLLFTLDPSEPKALVRRAKAQAASISAQLAEAQRDLKRSRELAAKGFFSASAVDTAESKVDTLSAELKAAQAEVSAASVQLDYTRIHAPISAKAGAVNVFPGSLAQQGDASPLVTLLQFDPIGAEFTVPEQHLAGLLAARSSGETAVSVLTLDGKAIDGELTFINNLVNTQTGTIALKARFPNSGDALWPGSFVRLQITAGIEKSAIVLPPQAVLEGPEGHFVFQVDDEGKAVSRPVRLRRIQDELAVVDGLQQGERVVVEGNQNLRSGSSVKVTEEGQTPSTSSAAR